MTDQEITGLCARAMGLRTFGENNSLFPKAILVTEPSLHVYAPLDDDAQAMALVKRFKLEPRFGTKGEWQSKWLVTAANASDPFAADASLNRAICLCAAKVQKEKETQ